MRTTPQKEQFYSIEDYKSLPFQRAVKLSKRASTSFYLLEDETYNDIEYEVFMFTEILTHTGECGCYQSCDCISSKGSIEVIETKFYRRKEYFDTNKSLYTKPI